MRLPDGYNRHHLLFPKAEYRKHTMPNLLREHPVNIQRLEVWRHNDLHAHAIGGLAVMSHHLARELLEFLSDMPSDIYDDQRRLQYLIREQNYMDRLTHRKGMLGKEATYFARAFEFQIPYIKGL